MAKGAYTITIRADVVSAVNHLRQCLEALGVEDIDEHLRAIEAKVLDAVEDDDFAGGLDLPGDWRQVPTEPGVDMSRPDDHGMLPHRHG